MIDLNTNPQIVLIFDVIVTSDSDIEREDSTFSLTFCN
jgi:hypothetical protein